MLLLSMIGSGILTKAGTSLPLQRLDRDIGGEGAEPVGLHRRPGLQALFLPQFEELPGVLAGDRHLGRPCLSMARMAPAESAPPSDEDAVDLRIGEEQAGHRFLGRRDIVGRVGLGEDRHVRIGLEHRLGALAAVSLTETPAGPFRIRILPLPPMRVDQELRRLLAPLRRSRC